MRDSLIEISRRSLLVAGATAAAGTVLPLAKSQAEESAAPIVEPPAGKPILISCKLGMIAKEVDGKKLTLAERLRLASQAGFDGVDFDEAGAFTAQQARDLRDYAARVAVLPLAADPGTRFGYDGAATELLSRVVEVVSGQRFSDFLQQRILAPLRMRDTGFEVPAAQRHRVVDATVMGDDGRLRLADFPAPGARLNAYDSGAGGLYSTAADYARFCQMLLDGGTLDGATILGRVTIGKGATIGGNVWITDDVPAGASVTQASLQKAKGTRPGDC